MSAPNDRPMNLERIPVRVEPAEPALTGNAPAVLKEIAALVGRLLEAGEGGAIDLASLPFSPADRAWLAEHLGRGEVEIHMQAGGLSTYLETRYPSVWWVRHRNDAGALVSEMVEVAWVPDIVAAHPDDVKIGLERLDNLIYDLH